MRFRPAVMMLALASSLCLAASPQTPNMTKYLLTTVGSFEATEENGIAYSMAYSVREPLPAQVFAVATFENPVSSKQPVRMEFEVPAGEKTIRVRSPGFHSIRNDTLYTVSLSLYLDPDHKNRLVKHDQKVLFKMGTEMHGFLQQRYGVTVELTRRSQPIPATGSE